MNPNRPGPVVQELDESGTDEIDGIAIPQIHLHDSPPTGYPSHHHVANVSSDTWATRHHGPWWACDIALAVTAAAVLRRYRQC